LPGDLRLTAADAIYNLRSALDQAVCRCAVLAGTSPKETYFPHGSDLAGFEESIRTKCKKISGAVRDAIAALEPYHGGNGYLFRVLHDLNLVDKHTDLLAIGLAIPRAEMRQGKGLIPSGEIWRRTEDSFEPLPAGTINEVDHQFKVTIAVTFLGVEAVEGQSASRILAQLRDHAIQAVDVIEEAAGIA